MNDLGTMRSITSPQYGITEAKKAEIDAISSEVVNAQHKVDQLQTVVSALQVKATQFEDFLTQAENSFDVAKSNKDTLNLSISNAKELLESSIIASKEMITASSKSDQQSELSNKVINELIYSVEVINKLKNLIIRSKASNPLISDELVSIASKASEDANNAVALTLIALKSSISAQTSNAESEAITVLEVFQAKKLLKSLSEEDDKKPGIEVVLTDTYNIAKSDLYSAEIASNNAKKQLNEATILLNKAVVKLNSLKLSLAAANAAATMA